MCDIIEPARKLPVYGKFDTVVCGGGFAGVAAALAAARSGNRVLLCERMFMLGGLGTAGLITYYLPLCDAMGHQLSYGIAEELLRKSICYGYETRYPDAWLDGDDFEKRTKQRFEVRYNAAVCAIVMEQMLQEAGVELLYGTTVCSAVVNDRKITHLVIENKSGRSAVEVGNVIDCTGDADVCVLAGEDTQIYQQKNILAAWYYFCNESGYDLKMLGWAEKPNALKNPEELTAGEKFKRYTGIDAKEITEMMMDSHQAILDDFVKKAPLSNHRMLATIASIPQLRMTRRIVGQTEIDCADDHRVFTDSVGMFGNWKRSGAGQAFELPYSTLYGKKIRNLACAGRCISSTETMWDITRVIPVCAVSGEAAGTAAGLCRCFDEVNITDLQNKLRDNGVKLHLNEL